MNDDEVRAVLDHPLIGARYFFPRDFPRDFHRDCPRDDDPSIRFAAARDDATLACMWRARERARTVVAFHGNGEVASECDELLWPIVDGAGCSLLAVEYRGYGGSTGAPAIAAMLDDAVAVFDAARIAPARTIAFGRSVGSLFAIELAARRGLAGLVLESGIHDVEERLRLRVAPRELGVDDAIFTRAVRARLDHGAKLAAFTGRTLVLHADDDELVDVRHAIANARAARGSRLVRFPAGGHNAIYAMNRASYDAELAAFFAASVDDAR